MASCTNATRNPFDRTASLQGVLRPSQTERVASLRREYPVSEALRPFVERYWTVRWDLGDTVPYRGEVLSHPCVNVSVESGSLPRFGVKLPAALVHGVVTRRFTVDLVGSGAVVAAKFRPGGFAAMAGVLPRHDTVTSLDAHLSVGADVVAAVLTPEDDVERAAALDAVLSPLATRPPPAYLDLLDVVAEMRQDRGLVRVDAVAGRARMGVRALQRLFAAYVGVSPKAVLARYRLQDAVAAIDAGEVDDLAGVAAAFGWSDQAHFSRDFRTAVGTTPSAYLRAARATRDASDALR